MGLCLLGVAQAPPALSPEGHHLSSESSQVLSSQFPLQRPRLLGSKLYLKGIRSPFNSPHVSSAQLMQQSPFWPLMKTRSHLPCVLSPVAAAGVLVWLFLPLPSPPHNSGFG